MSMTWKTATLGALVVTAAGVPGCHHHRAWNSPGSCNSCQSAGAPCEPCGNTCESGCNECGSKKCGGKCRGACIDNFFLHISAKLHHRRSGAIPDTLPLGSTVRSHYQVMETNAEAADFIFHQHDFIGETAELTPDGKDKLMEIHARMNAQPFPVLVERTTNNADPELDALRRNLIAQILTDFGHMDAQHRTVVATPYSKGYLSPEAENTYRRHLNGSNGFNNNIGNNTGAGGFGGGGGGFGGGF